jgi:UDP-N-acetylmuramyl tripeptide synthase
MKVLTQQVLRGPNYWSHNHPKLVQTRVQVEQGKRLQVINDSLITAFIEQFAAGLEPKHATEPCIAHCHVLCTLSLALQRAAGCMVTFSASRPTAHPDIFLFVAAYTFESAGVAAAKAAIKICSLDRALTSSDFSHAIEIIRQAADAAHPPRVLGVLLGTATDLHLPIIQLEQPNHFYVGYGSMGLQINAQTELIATTNKINSGAVGRIPVIAVTGSNGKTTTTRLIAHIVRLTGACVGFTTSDGIYINDETIDEGDTTGPISAQTVLCDPRVERAVLETARGGILRAGLGFDQCDIAVVTNVQDDHLGISDIETMDDLANVKAVVVKALKPGGIAVLNASNTYTAAFETPVNTRRAWFSIDVQQAAMQHALVRGESVAFVEDHHIVLQTEKQKLQVINLNEVPITFKGSLTFMIENALAATVAAAMFGVSLDLIARGLRSFYPSLEQTPGRMNVFNLQGHTLLVDFAHNPDGFAGIRDFLATIDAPFKIGIIVGTGDRKDEDTQELGRLSAQMFDLVLIHQVKFLRGKTAEALVEQLVLGMQLHNPQTQWLRIPDNEEPLAFALKLAKPGSHITALSEVLSDVPSLVQVLR